ncbi:MAG: hypothetical protein NZM34_13795, partial [Bernardetiaceae bacterium]|nr:hypothetical protein [Bernardetiaceae bacterium]
HFLKALSALLSLSNLPRNTDKIVAYSIRSKSFEERFAIIDFVLSQDAQTNDLVIIDGIVDLSADPVLKRDEATTIVSMLMKHAENKQIHILSVLHENSSNERGRGHIYAEIANKCEAVFSVKKESDKPLADSTIELIVSRNYAEGKVTFNIENGVPKAVEATHTVTYSIYAFADAVKEIFKREKTEWITAGRLQTLIVDYKRAKQTATKLPRNKNEILEALARLLDAFQFLNGTIKITRPFLFGRLSLQFQFLNGTIKINVACMAIATM